MKKIISLLLVAVMCLSFVACSSGNNNDNESAKKEIVGEWKNLHEDYSFTFNEDGTGTTPSNGSLTWKYDSELSCYSTYVGSGITLSISNINTAENGARYISIEGKKYYHIDDYDKAVEIEYSEKYNQLMKYYNTKTKVEMGQTINTEIDGLSINFISVYVEKGDLFIKAILKNEIDTELNVKSYLVLTGGYINLIHHDASTSGSGNINFVFKSENQTSDTIHIPAGETLEVVAKIKDDMKTNIRFFGLYFRNGGTYSDYWIDVTDYVS